jgi:hypothetical protein
MTGRLFIVVIQTAYGSNAPIRTLPIAAAY